MDQGRSKLPLDSRSAGLLVVAAIILGMILLRWGSTMVWSAR